jgi:hypothetical protein
MSTITTTPAVIQPLLFLDTNALHFTRLYLAYAKKNNVAPFNGTPEDAEKQLKTEFGNRGDALKGFLKGKKVAETLAKETSDGKRIEYSPVARVEMHCGYLKGRAICAAAHQAMPSRWWSKIDDTEIFHRLDRAAYSEICSDAQQIEVLFGDAGILISETDPSNLREMWALTEAVLNVVFLDYGDCSIYAAAISSMADEILTYDGYLNFVANGLYNPGGTPPEHQDHFKWAQSTLANVVSIVTGQNQAEVQFPKAIKI